MQQIKTFSKNVYKISKTLVQKMEGFLKNFNFLCGSNPSDFRRVGEPTPAFPKIFPVFRPPTRPLRIPRST